MPKRHPRNKDLSEHEVLKSDSDDENYTDSQGQNSPRTKRKRTTGGKSKKRPQKSRKRRQYSTDNDDDISEELDDLGGGLESESSIEDDEPQLGPSGRPMRHAVAKKVNYVEDSNEEIEDSDSNDAVPRKRGGKGAHSGPSRLVIKLRVPQNSHVTGQESVPTTLRRSTRATSNGPQARSATAGKAPTKGPGKAPAKGVTKARGRGASTGPPVAGLARRSSRLGHGEETPLAALSNSGRHAEIISGPGMPSQILEERESAMGSSKEGECAIEDDPLDADADADADAAIGTQRLDDQLNEVDDPDIVPLAEEQDPTGPVVVGGDEEHDAEDEDEGPTRRTRGKGISQQVESVSPKAYRPTAEPRSADRGSQKGSRRAERRRLGRATSRKTGDSDEDEYHDDGDSTDESMSDGASPSKSKSQFVVDDEGSDPNTRSTRNKGKGLAGSKRRYSLSDELTQAELAEEVQALVQPKKRRTRVSRGLQGDEGAISDRPALRKRNHIPDYRIFRPENANLLEPEGSAGSDKGSKKKGSGDATIGLFNTFGPFGGSESMGLFGGPAEFVEIDSDSSDDEGTSRRTIPGAGFGGAMGMTPTNTHAAGLLPPVPQTHNIDALQSGAGGPANLGKVTAKSKNAPADTDPLSVSADLTFDSVGGLDDKIQQLKEMVMLPLMYPEVFLAKNTTPPRGVLFHGPPGTGKTLMARVLAASCSSEGRKVTFYMRKGADILSKWVGEAERQLRLLFEEARNNQPSILFFDEIDGLAPVRSSKQEQIHASIVSTLLALMDGMDGRGQVVVIGATNRPDAVDPALRRPGRFDREFYFPLPATEARRKIIDIHTKGWQPELEPSFKDHLAEMTKGYGGADLRALCTEAALISIQRTYPQIYKSTEKLKVDPNSIQVTARDFMMSMQKMIPSSERSSSSGAAPLPSHVQPLLARSLDTVKVALETIMPQRKRLTALEEAEYEDDGSGLNGFQRELMMQNFENSRVYRPRLLIWGPPGMGQQYIGAAVLHHLEHVFVQSFDLAALMSDTTRSPEAAIVQLFVEVKRHKPSVIFIPNVDVWYQSLPLPAIASFKGLLQSIPPNEQILVLGMTDSPEILESQNHPWVKEIFGYSKKDRIELRQPDLDARYKYFDNVRAHVEKSPRDFFDPESRPKRALPQLERATPPPPEVPTVEDVKAQDLKDRQVKNWLKMRLHNLIEKLKPRFRVHKKPAVDHDIVRKILAPPPPPPQNDDVVSDIRPPVAEQQPLRFRPYYDDDGELRVEDKQNNKTYYNLDFDIIEDRFSNGYYSHPQQLITDIKRIKHDIDIVGEKATRRKVNDILTAAEVYVADMEMDVDFIARCNAVQQRERKKVLERREKLARKKAAKEKARRDNVASNSRRPSNDNDDGAPGNSRQHPAMIPETPDPKAVRSSGSNGIPAREQMRDILEPEVTATPHHPLAHENGSIMHGFGSNYQTPQHTQNTLDGYNMTQLESGAGGPIKVARVQGPMSLSVVVNDASITTSGGKRTSDGTTTNSQPSYPLSIANATAGSNGTGENHSTPPASVDVPHFHSFGGGLYHQGDSQLPATQEIQSSAGSGAPSSQSYIASAGASQLYPYQSQSQGQVSSQASLPPPSSNTFKFPAVPTPALKCSPSEMDRMQRRLSTGTSGYSIEQLEQVTAALMDIIWRNKSSYDRDDVARKVQDAFDELAAEIVAAHPEIQASQSFGS